jgi:hypothetical protein
MATNFNRLSEAQKEKRREYNREYGRKHREERTAARREWYKQNTEKVKQKQREYYKENRGHYRDYCIAHNAQLRHEALMHYSKGAMCCSCCGEPIEDFLTLDHPKSDGAKHRRSIGTGKTNGRREGSGGSFYSKLKQAGYPPGLRVYCYNCNCGSFKHGGVCPHTFHTKGSGGSLHKH